MKTLVKPLKGNRKSKHLCFFTVNADFNVLFLPAVQNP